ncbi:hypothetical protein ACWC5I_42975, partial [Kitasatospora sp. NPDC001574]
SRCQLRDQKGMQHQEFLPALHRNESVGSGSHMPHDHEDSSAPDFLGTGEANVKGSYTPHIDYPAGLAGI